MAFGTKLKDNVGARSKMANGAVVKTEIMQVSEHTEISITQFPNSIGSIWRKFDYPVRADVVLVDGLHIQLRLKGNSQHGFDGFYNIRIDNMDLMDFTVTRHKYEMKDCVEVVKGFGATKQTWEKMWWNRARYFDAASQTVIPPAPSRKRNPRAMLYDYSWPGN